MRLSTVAIWLYAVIGAIANNEAAPAELEYLYALYKAEWVVLGKDGARTIATGCVHDGPTNWPTGEPTPPTLRQSNIDDEAAFVAAAAALGVTGICAFDEFVKHIGVQSTFSKWKYDRAGHSFDPPWGGIKSKAGKAAQGNHAFRYDFTLLFPGAFTDTELEAWNKGVRLANTKFTSLRQAAMAAGKDISTMVKNGLAYIEFAWTTNRESVTTTMVQKYLSSDAGGKVGKKNFLSFVQYTREVVAGPDGGGGVTIQKFNFDGTVAKAAADAQITTLTADQEDGMKKAVTDFEASAEFTKHEDVILAMKEGVGSLTLDLAACSASSATRRRGLFGGKRANVRAPHKRQAHLRSMFASGLLVRSKFIY
ncbi:hypothetical protein LQW54_004818 [Pestalotiopsis sp. IQ-011]